MDVLPGRHSLRDIVRRARGRFNFCLTRADHDLGSGVATTEADARTGLEMAARLIDRLTKVAARCRSEHQPGLRNQSSHLALQPGLFNALN